MLKIQLVMLSMLLLPMVSTNFMWYITFSLIVLTITSTVILMPHFSYMMTSCISAFDTMSSSLIILTIWVTAMMILASSKVFLVKMKSKSFIYYIILLLFILVNCFMSPNMFMFYIWFEASLIPTMILIMVWGYQPERVQASMYLMIYTVTASLPLLCMLFLVMSESSSVLMPMSMCISIPTIMPVSSIVWIMLLGGFMVKLPLFTVHLWLPKAHVEAPIAGSMILAAILLKLGGYGILRMLFLLGASMPKVNLPIIGISLLGGVVTSAICLRQSDLKSLIAYSSVGHMGLMLAGALTKSVWGMQASLAMMIAHGLSSSALFVMANINYEFSQTRSLFLTKGILVIMPIFTMWWFLFSASNMAAPPSINLLSEIMLMASVLSLSIYSLVFLGIMSFLTAAYSLYMYTSMHHGKMWQLSNSWTGLKTKEYVLMFMHLIPIILLILKPEMITAWNT
uniref:NADH-ubiquinone oxidoreductase chain 4 n=1 Tax=Drawida japonica TaxID=408826 RepID=A0A0N6W281_9ANNE|nr:NADH dehydrogenase subunit 4 [Drawida japonica]AIR76352.1 NADH dehydrogenase subunit 4 [Drawida japonica]